MSAALGERPPAPGGAPMAARGPSRLLRGCLAALLAAGVVVGAAFVEDQVRSDRLAPGLSIGGVDVGGLTTGPARTRLEQRAVAPRRRTLRVHAGGRTFALAPAQARPTADLDVALRQGIAESRRGWLGARVLHDLTGHRVARDVPLKMHYARGVVPRLVAEVASVVRRPAVNASVRPSAAGLSERHSRTGRALDAGDLQRRVASALVFPSHPADIVAKTEPVAPKVTTARLAAKYEAYIVIDRKAHVLRFFEHLKPFHTYPIAVGMQGLETPSGLYDVQWKQTNPSWYVPKSAWAGKLAGKVIPPGPDDPIKARWMAFNGGAGIHGIDPGEYGTIGHDASHGCVRMRIPDVISLYARTPVGTPVYVA